jgi:hypothetical protein
LPEKLTAEQRRRIEKAVMYVHPAYGPELALERVAINQGALCIECKACGRRSALTSKNCAHIRVGNKTLVKTMKFRCQRHGCAATETRLYNAHTLDEAEMFLAGDPLPPARRVR